MFSLSDLDLENAPVIAPVEEGSYRVRLLELAIRSQQAPKTGVYLTAALDVTDEPTAETVRHFVTMMPDRSMPDKDAVRAKSRIKAFLDHFNLPYSMEQVEADGRIVHPEAVGAEAVVYLGVRDGQNGEPENFIKTLQAPTPGA